MSTDHSFDRESLQSLLANAFSVQQSGMTPESLAAVIEIQRSIATATVDADQAMQLIAEHARAVANATGIGIALIEGNQLAHCAGSGSASNNVGRHLSAVLSASAHVYPRREILRVEDTEKDSRVEAEICRQFDARALLMVPIYREQIMVGVLEILFDGPHAFEEPEVRTYQLMATLVGEATALAEQIGDQVPASQASSTVWHALSRMISAVQPLRVATKPMPQPTPGSHSLFQPIFSSWRQWSHSARILRFRAMLRRARQNLSLPTLRWQHRLPHKLQWRAGAVRDVPWSTAGVCLLIAVAIGASMIRHRRTAAAPVADSTVSSSKTLTTQGTAAGQQQSLASTEMKNASGGAIRNAGLPTAAFKRVWVGQDEVDYIADDVTIRHFRSRPEPLKTHAWSKQVNIGSDVTVRYFNGSAVRSKSNSASNSDQAVTD